jgi:hypothetical protein
MPSPSPRSRRVFVCGLPEFVAAGWRQGDRADIRPLGTECGEKTWPYFDAACTRDARIPLVQPRDVRMIAADRAAN